MWQPYVQAFLFALALSGIAFGIAQVVVVLGERSIERKAGTVGLKKKLVERAKFEQRLEARRVERVAELKALDGETKGVIARKQHLERQVGDLLRSGDTIVRLIGEEVTGSPCFVAQVVNKYIGTGDQQQRHHAFIDASWARPQTVEVWSPNIQQARTEIERRYPPAFGYVVTRLQPVAGVAAPAG